MSPRPASGFPPAEPEALGTALHTVVEVEQPLFQALAVRVPCHPVYPGRGSRVQGMVGPFQGLHRHMVQQRRKTFLRFPLGCLPYPVSRL